ncbi:Bromo adjacent-like domain protein, partial [Thalictrum thalictroides]
MDVQKLCNGFVKEPNSPASLSKKDMIQHTPKKHLAVDCHVDVLSQDSGIRGCWFRVVVIKRSKLKVKVRYHDIKDAEDETKSVEEWVLASRIAVPDQLGIRLCGRTTLRPFPASNKDSASLGFVDVGTPVDAWWHYGWWEGIVVRKESNGKIHVYFPGEKTLSIFGCNDLRCSQDWLCNKWNSIESRPDLVNSILAGLATKQDGSKSCDGERAAFNWNVHCLKPQSDIGKEIKAVPNLVKDDLLAQLKWCSSRKRRRSRERSQRRANSGLKQRSNESSCSSREDLEPSIDCQRFLSPNSFVFDTESRKYQEPQDVLVVVDPKDYSVLLKYLKGDQDDDMLRRKLTWKAFEHVASYDSTVSEWLWKQTGRYEFPPSFTVPLSLKISLRYGENPNQKAAFYVDKSLLEVQANGIATAIQHLGK